HLVACKRARLHRGETLSRKSSVPKDGLAETLAVAGLGGGKYLGCDEPFQFSRHLSRHLRQCVHCPRFVGTRAATHPRVPYEYEPPICRQFDSPAEFAQRFLLDSAVVGQQPTMKKAVRSDGR